MKCHHFLGCAVLVCLLQIILGAELWHWNYETHNKDIHAVLRDSFDYHVTQGQFGIGSSLVMAEDPTSPGHYVMRVHYDKGSYSQTHDIDRGAQFYAMPSELSGHTHLTMTLEYELYFEDSFSWHRGGKLPGLWGGARTCSGGRIGSSCFSTRLMWRALGDGEVYAYVTHDQSPSWDDWCNKYDTSSTAAYKHIHCTSSTGIEIGKSAWRFHHHKWHHIRQEVHLNQSPGSHGYIKLWVDGHSEVHVTDIIMRDNTGFDIDGILFSTFYGGGDSSWACPHDTHTYFRNFKLSTDTRTPSSSELVG